MGGKPGCEHCRYSLVSRSVFIACCEGMLGQKVHRCRIDIVLSVKNVLIVCKSAATNNTDIKIALQNAKPPLQHAHRYVCPEEDCSPAVATSAF